MDLPRLGTRPGLNPEAPSFSLAGASSSSRGGGGRSHKTERGGGNGGSRGSSSAPSSSVPEAGANARGRNASRGRGGRPGPGRRGRGGLAAHGTSGTSIAPPRTFGAHLTAAAAAPDAASAPAPASAADGGPSTARSRRSRSASSSAASAPPCDPPAPTGPASTATDLMTRTYEDMDTNNYDCSICLAPVTRQDTRLWVCSMCFHVTHFDCLATWIERSVGLGTHPSGIRCVNCNTAVGSLPHFQAQSEDVRGLGPQTATSQALSYARALSFFAASLCWCGKQRTPAAAPAALPPHSCGRLCGRARPDCPHTCPLTCHAGPCPPCAEQGPLQACYCGRHTTVRPCTPGAYGDDASAAWSCGQVCGHPLACGEHVCRTPCHAGGCDPCDVVAPASCFCGKVHRDVPCAARQPAQASVGPDGRPFDGVFSCGTVCGRLLDCGLHACPKTCHAQDAAPARCPLSPAAVTHCPCGKTALAALADRGRPARTSCADPIPTCGQRCGKRLDCGHACAQACHGGPCAPCAAVVEVSCACASTTRQVVCSDHAARAAVRCANPCRRLLHCGRHGCQAVCCPGRVKAAAAAAAVRRKPVALPVPPGGELAVLPPRASADVPDEHVCARVCGRPLRCGNKEHVCRQPCHKGACHACTEWVLDDLRCPCRQAVLLRAPYLCGTAPPSATCDANCPRPLPCGHRPVPHPCHDPAKTPCPRCPRLVAKACLCGKLVLPRVTCGADHVQCSRVCGAVLACGVHTCRKTCHAPGQCEDVDPARGAQAPACRQTCGRAKPACRHPCSGRCHGADTPCDEAAPCSAAVAVHCDCGRLARKVRCNACRDDPAPAARRAACDDECLRIQRNQRLKEALRISDDYKDEHLAYDHELMALFLAHRALATEVEARVRAFFGSPGAGAASDKAGKASRASDANDASDDACDARHESAASKNSENEEDQATRRAAQPAPVRTLVFRPMTSPERQFVHRLAEAFGLRSESRDVEPHRHVAVFRRAQSSGAPAVPLMTLGESEEIYQRLRRKAEDAAAAAAAEKAAERTAKKEALQKEAAQAGRVAAAAAADDAPEDERRPRRRPFNALFVPRQLATRDPLLADDAFQTIVAAWHEHQRQQTEQPAPRCWLSASTFAASWQATASSSSSSSGVASAAALRQHTLLSGDVVLRVVVPAAPPAVVEQLAAFLLPYAAALWPDGAAARPALCTVGAQNEILRMGGASLDDADADEQWSVVAAPSSSLRRLEAASATPPPAGAPPGQGKQRRLVLTKKKAPAVAKTSWMSLMAQHLRDEEGGGGEEDEPRAATAADEAEDLHAVREQTSLEA